MRPKFLLALTVVTGLILAAALFLHQQARLKKSSVAGNIVIPPPLEPAPYSPPLVRLAAQAEPPPSPEEKRAAVNRQIQQLQLWAQADDPAGLENIMNELVTNSEPKVRLAAILAAKQSGSREIVPRLNEAAVQAEGFKEKKALLDAADFLAQPTVSEEAANLQPVAVLTP